MTQRLCRCGRPLPAQHRMYCEECLQESRIMIQRGALPEVLRSAQEVKLRMDERIVYEDWEG